MVLIIANNIPTLLALGTEELMNLINERVIRVVIPAVRP
jgi:hypothetical protein